MANIEFTPEQQAKVDEIVKARISREKERWEKESGTEDLKAQLAAKDEEISQIQREHYRASARRAVVEELAASGVTEEGRIERILRHVDFDAIENPPRTASPTSAT
jgi:intergrase/recombinase